jgi:hypothetical protein
MDMTDREGLSAFYEDGHGAVFHTYSCYARGIDLLNTAYNVLDLRCCREAGCWALLPPDRRPETAARASGVIVVAAGALMVARGLWGASLVPYGLT